MTRSWARFLRAPAPGEHAVQLYSGSDELVEAVASYLAAGFEQGEPAVVIATRAHCALFEESLGSRGWDRASLAERGLVELRDAEETLKALIVGRRPSAARFERVVGGTIGGLAARFPGKQLRAFGEMVDVLCSRGDRRAAAELEELWTRLAERRRFSLLCAYRVDLFDSDAQISLLPQICAAHTHVQPAGDVERLGDAVCAALEEELGSGAVSVWAQLPPGVGRSGRLPAAERALMWISANMPGRAERILASARARYATAGAAVSAAATSAGARERDLA
jgi:hypothetical protein